MEKDISITQRNVFVSNNEVGGGSPNSSQPGRGMCWAVENHCQVMIATHACAHALCGAEVKIWKARKVYLEKEDCDPCPEGVVILPPSRSFMFCDAVVWPQPGLPGEKRIFKSVDHEHICVPYPPTMLEYSQSLDFNCGPTALFNAKEMERLANEMERCMERGYGDSSAPGGDGGAFSKKLCDLASITNGPGGGPDGTPGGIGNKEECRGLSNQEDCEDAKSEEYMKALSEWLKKNCRNNQ